MSKPQLAVSLRLPPEEDVSKAVARRLDAGFGRLGLEGPLYPFQVDALVAAVGFERWVSVRLFLPYPRGLEPGAPCPFELGSLHSEAKRDAYRQGVTTIEFADRHAIPYVLLPPGRLDLPAGRGRPVASGEALSAELTRRCLAEREDRMGPHLSSYLSTVERLLEVADNYSIRLAIAPTGRLDSFPAPAEVEVCLREFRGAPLVPWRDTAWELERLATAPSVAKASAPGGTTGRADTSPSDEGAGEGGSLLEAEASQLLNPLTSGATEQVEPAGVTVRGLHIPQGNDEVALTRAAVRPLLEGCPIWLWDAGAGVDDDALCLAREFLDSTVRGPVQDPFV